MTVDSFKNTFSSTWEDKMRDLTTPTATVIYGYTWLHIKLNRNIISFLCFLSGSDMILDKNKNMSCALNDTVYKLEANMFNCI